MITRIDKSGTNLELGEDVVKYIDRKVGRLDRFMPRAYRKAVRAKVILRDKGNQDGSMYECEATLYLPGGNITARESTLNKFAAIDIVEAKLRNQLREYKEDARASEHSGVARRVRQRMAVAKSQDK
jgi:ribosomal subunit interface protein